eukprot:PhM_4_TR8083/c0_g1_i1/m.5993
MDLTFRGEPNTIPIRITGPQLDTYSTSIVFQDLKYIALLGDTVTVDQRSGVRQAVTSERITFNLVIQDSARNAVAGDDATVVSVHSNHNLLGDTAPKKVVSGSVSFVVYFTAPATNVTVTFSVSSSLLAATVSAAQFQVVQGRTPAPLPAAYVAPTIVMRMALYKSVEQFNATEFTALIANHVTRVNASNVVVQKVCDANRCVVYSTARYSRRLLQTTTSPTETPSSTVLPTLAPTSTPVATNATSSGVEVYWRVQFASVSNATELEAIVTAATEEAVAQLSNGTLRSVLQVEGDVTTVVATTAPPTATPALTSPPPSPTPTVNTTGMSRAGRCVVTSGLSLLLVGVVVVLFVVVV